MREIYEYLHAMDISGEIDAEKMRIVERHIDFLKSKTKEIRLKSSIQ